VALSSVPGPAAGQPGGQGLGGEDAVRAAVARFGVSTAAQAVSAGLAKSVDATNLTSLGSDLAAPLDAFRAASDTFAPPSTLGVLPASADAAALASNARRVYATALALAHRLISELQVLLGQRAGVLSGQRRSTGFVTGIAAAAGLLMVWLLAIARPTAIPTESSVDTDVPGRVAPARPLVLAEELLEAERVIHVGRAVHTGSGRQRDAG
jgi:hypothetical protein